MLSASSKEIATTAASLATRRRNGGHLEEELTKLEAKQMAKVARATGVEEEEAEARIAQAAYLHATLLQVRTGRARSATNVEARTTLQKIATSPEEANPKWFRKSQRIASSKSSPRSISWKDGMKT